MDMEGLEQDKLVGEDLPKMIFIRVEDAYNLLWERNPKLHNIGELIQSFIEHGFQELPKYDATLKAIKAGNGRIEALYIMSQDKDYKDKRPRGIAEIESGDWVMPLLVGTDAKSLDLAIAYAVDSNNLTMSGGDFTGLDISRMWDSQEYINILSELVEKDIFSVSVNEEHFDFLLRIQDIGAGIDYTQEWQGMPEMDQEDMGFFKEIIIRFILEDDYREFAKLIQQTLTEKTKSIWYPKQDFDQTNRDYKYTNES